MHPMSAEPANQEGCVDSQPLAKEKFTMDVSLGNEHPLDQPEVGYQRWSEKKVFKTRLPLALFQFSSSLRVYNKPFFIFF